MEQVPTLKDTRTKPQSSLRQRATTYFRLAAKGLIQDMEILEEPPMDRHIDVVSIYLGKDNQQPYYDYLLKIKPDHVIFNPGTENPELEQMLTEKGIRNEEACSLVLMRIGEL